MKTNVNAVLVIALVIGGFSASANAREASFPQRQTNAILDQQNQIRRGIEAGSIHKELCIYFVQSLQDMKKNAFTVAAATAPETSEMDQLASVEIMSVQECK